VDLDLDVRDTETPIEPYSNPSTSIGPKQSLLLGIPSLPIILLDNVSGFHRRISYDTLERDGELDATTTSPSDIVGTGFGLTSHHIPIHLSPRCPTSGRHWRPGDAAYCISINSDDRLSSRYRSTFSLFGTIWVSQSLSSSSLENNDNFSFTTRPSPTSGLPTVDDATASDSHHVEPIWEGRGDRAIHTRISSHQLDLILASSDPDCVQGT
jgi:hypothetical protein